MYLYGAKSYPAGLFCEAHLHIHAHIRTHEYAIDNCNPSKQIMNMGLRRKETAVKGKTWGGGAQLLKKKVFRLDLKESQECFLRRGRGRAFHVEGPKTEKARNH